jgi:hypothetical protein
MKVVRTTVICLWPYIAWFINSLYKDNPSLAQAIFLSLWWLGTWAFLCLTVVWSSREGFKWLFIDIAFSLCLLFPALLLDVLLKTICLIFPAVGDSLMLISLNDGRADSAGLCYFIGFSYTMALCTLWYAFKYDPTGTVNPDWTGVFG